MSTNAENGPLFLVQANVDITAATRHVGQFASHSAVRDPDYLIKTILTDALSGPTIRPWALRGRRGRQATIVGYSKEAPEAINRRLTMALPSAKEAISEVMGYALPGLSKGDRLRFAVRLCPTIRSTRRGETDAFLIAADEAGDGPTVIRDDVYADYLRQRLNGADIDYVRMTGFRLNKMIRKTTKSGTGFTNRTFPEARLEGELTVTDPESLQDILGKGLGRQRGFGFGMVQLEPARHGSR